MHFARLESPTAVGPVSPHGPNALGSLRNGRGDHTDRSGCFVARVRSRMRWAGRRTPSLGVAIRLIVCFERCRLSWEATAMWRAFGRTNRRAHSFGLFRSPDPSDKEEQLQVEAWAVRWMLAMPMNRAGVPLYGWICLPTQAGATLRADCTQRAGHSTS